MNFSFKLVCLKNVLSGFFEKARFFSRSTWFIYIPLAPKFVGKCWQMTTLLKQKRKFFLKEIFDSIWKPVWILCKKSDSTIVQGAGVRIENLIFCSCIHFLYALCKVLWMLMIFAHWLILLIICTTKHWSIHRIHFCFRNENWNAPFCHIIKLGRFGLALKTCDEKHLRFWQKTSCGWITRWSFQWYPNYVVLLFLSGGHKNLEFEPWARTGTSMH